MVPLFNMMRSTMKIIQFSNQIRLFSKGQVGTISSISEKWDLFTAVCVERKPVITQELNEIEMEYKQLMEDIEYERSLKCDHELQHETDLKYIENLKKGGEVAEADVNLKQTAQDRVDAWTEESSMFKPASRTTEADSKNDVKSLRRKLDKNLILVVNQKLGEKNLFLLPQSKREDGETLRQTAERIIKQSCGGELKTQIYGNAPTGFYKYKYPKNVFDNTGIVGAKVFIYFARYLGGTLSPKYVDYKWLDRLELKKTLPPQYSANISQFLIDE